MIFAINLKTYMINAYILDIIIDKLYYKKNVSNHLVQN